MQRIWTWIKSPGVMAAVAIFSIALAIYLGFIYERKPELTVKVETLSPVFDIHQPVGGLSVSYAGEDLRSTKKALWVFKATLSNSGNAEIKKGDYDEMAPWGLDILNAQVVDRPSLTTSNPYLEKNLQIDANETSIRLSPVIFEPGDAFDITLLLLGPEAVKPQVRATGKIAGVKSIALIEPNWPEDTLPVWYQVIRGNSFWVQLIRAAVYFFGTLALFLLFAVLMASIVSTFDSFKKKRKKSERETRIREYRLHGELGKVARYLMNIYTDNGDEGFSRFARAIEHRQAREDAISKLKESSVSDEVIQELVERAFSEKRYIFDGYYNEKIEDELRSAKLLEGEKLGEKLVDGFPEAIKDLAEFLNIDLKGNRDAYVKRVIARRNILVAGPEDASDFPPH